jgi:tetratricopeptide (TPR) repeat protein
VIAPHLVHLYETLPPLLPGDDPDLWAANLQSAMREFRRSVRAKYTEGTLQRLLKSTDPTTRRAAVLALGMIGSGGSSASIAGMLHDKDRLVQRFAGDALWEIWFRGSSSDQSWELRQALRMPDVREAINALTNLIRQSPAFAEAYNQRAILYFRRGDFVRSAADCERAMQLNPYHFGAAAGLGQCLMKLKKPRAALRAFKTALDLNPTLDHLRATIRTLSEALDAGRDESER